MPEKTVSPARLTGEPPPLIFDWGRERGVRRRLAMWLLLVSAGLTGMFYVFRVAPPLVSRKPPPQHAVLYLPPGKPEVRALLSTMEDRWPGAVLPGGDESLPADIAALAKITPRSEPSWSAHRAVLKPFPQPLVPAELPALMEPGQPLLPEPEEGPPLPPLSLKTGRPAPYAVLENEASGRTVVQPAVWPPGLMDDTWPASGSVAFMLGVSRNGVPEYCLPLTPAAGVDLEALRNQLLAMKFNAAASGGIQWLTVAVKW